jgi:hypothetical protein
MPRFRYLFFAARDARKGWIDAGFVRNDSGVKGAKNAGWGLTSVFTGKFT